MTNDVIKLKTNDSKIILAYVKKGEGTVEEVSHLKETLKEACDNFPTVAVVDEKLLSHIEIVSLNEGDNNGSENPSNENGEPDV